MVKRQVRKAMKRDTWHIIDLVGDAQLISPIGPKAQNLKEYKCKFLNDEKRSFVILSEYSECLRILTKSFLFISNTI